MDAYLHVLNMLFHLNIIVYLFLQQEYNQLMFIRAFFIIIGVMIIVKKLDVEGKLSIRSVWKVRFVSIMLEVLISLRVLIRGAVCVSMRILNAIVFVYFTFF